MEESKTSELALAYKNLVQATQRLKTALANGVEGRRLNRIKATHERHYATYEFLSLQDVKQRLEKYKVD